MVQAWIDNTGLYRKYGTDQGVATIAGEYRNNGQLRELEFKVTLADLTETETILSDVNVVPAGARIVEIETITHTAGATGTAIDVGLIKTDRATEIDYNGLLAAAPIANYNLAGETSVYRQAVTIPTGLTGVGALVGTNTAFVGYVTASRTDTTAFTAGILHMKIRYYMP